jgi:hypothetical protein
MTQISLCIAFFSRFSHAFNALGGYATTIHSHLVVNCTLIIRSCFVVRPSSSNPKDK